MLQYSQLTRRAYTAACRTILTWSFAILLVSSIGCRDSDPPTAPASLHRANTLALSASVTSADYSLVPFNSQGSSAGGLSAVNTAGHAAGSEYGVLSNGQGYTSFLWTNSNSATPVIACCGLASAINRADEVVGWGGPFPQTLAFAWTPSGGVVYPPLLPGSTTGRAIGVNDAGVVVGVSSASDFTHGRATAWFPGAEFGTFTAVDLGALPGDDYSVAQAINAAGQIVGQSLNGAGESHAVLWQPTASDGRTFSVVALGMLGGSNSSALAINAAGQIVGQSAVADGSQDAFLWTAGDATHPPKMADLGPGIADGISDNGIVVGNAATGGGAWIWTASTGKSLLSSPSGTNANVDGINADGTSLVGYYRDPASGGQYPVMWRATGPIEACAPVSDGLVAWWKGDSTFADAVGGATATPNGGVSFVRGRVGSAFNFDGTGTLKASDVAIPMFGSARTLEFWLRPGVNSRVPVIYGGEEFADPLDAYYVLIDGTVACLGNWANGPGHRCGAPNVADGAWHHIAMTYSTGLASLYIDGALAATHDRTYYTNATGALLMGATASSVSGFGTDWYVGDLDEVSVYNRELSATEISAIYTAGTAGKCTAGSGNPPPNHPPTAAPGGPYPVAGTTATEGNAITFDGSRSSDPDGDALTYSWNFGDPNAAGGGTASGIRPTYQYADNGTYTVTLTVVDSKGATSTPVSSSVVVGNINPTGVLTYDPTVVEGSGFALAITSATDAPGDLPSLHYAFDCGDGQGYRGAVSYATTGPKAAASCPAPDGPSMRTVRGKVFDKDGGSSEYISNPAVSVTNAAPVPTLAASALTIKTSQAFTVVGSFSDVGTGDAPWTWAIDWHDGTPVATGTVSAQGTAISVDHAYKIEGTFTITLTVTDKDGGRGASSTTVTVSGGTNLSWTRMPSPTTATLFSVWGNSGKDVFAVGADNSWVPTALHFDGTVWRSMSLPVDWKYQLAGVSGNSPRNVYAVATGVTSTNTQAAKILHYNGSSWSYATSQTFYGLTAVWVSPIGTVYAVGYSPPSGGVIAPLVVRYDGRTWQILSAPPISGSLSAVWGTSDTDVYVLGTGGTIAHWNGSAWAMSANVGVYGFRAIWGASASDIYAGGLTPSSTTPSRLYHGVSGVWSALTIPGSADAINGIWGSSGSDVYAVGTTNSYSTLAILHYNGIAWSPMSTPAGGGYARAVWGSSPTNVFVVGDAGMILHGTP